ncbi:hypothetical protein BH24ACT26_BH24ACT26_01350 [soil metagenome]
MDRTVSALGALRRRWRWVALLGVVALLAALPGTIAGLPARDRPLGAMGLLERIRSSGSVAHTGVAESRAGLGLPDVPRAGRVVALFGETTRLRTWYGGPQSWRVDELTPIGERDSYRDPAGMWLWDSGARTATRIKGTSVVRFARPADLLPPELGRRLAAAAKPDEASRLPARRVAGVDALGVRVEPHSKDTTIRRVDLWADPDSGLPVRVEVTARGGAEPIVTSSFLDLEQEPPPRELLRFEPPADAAFNFTVAPDFAQAVQRYSPFVLPEALAGRPRRSNVAAAAATYGRGYGLVGVLALPERFSPEDELGGLPSIAGAWGQGHLVQTPLLNGLVFEREGVAYVLGGSVPPRLLKRFATHLAREGIRQR